MTAPDTFTNSPSRTASPDAARILATYATKAPFQPYARDVRYGDTIDCEVSRGKRYYDLVAERLDWALNNSCSNDAARALLATQISVGDAIAVAAGQSDRIAA